MFTGDIRYKLFPEGVADMALLGADLEQDEGLETAVIVSLFTNGRASDDDIIPDGSGDKQGWWGAYLLEDIEYFGSKLWLLSRSKITPEVIAQTKEHCESALSWIKDSEIAEDIIVDVEKAAELGEILFIVEIHRANSEAINFRYYYNWEAQIFRRV